MFLGETRYLEWANAQFPRATFDLAASGEPIRAVADPGPVFAKATLADLASAVARHNARPQEEVSLALGASHGLFLAYAALLTPNAGEHVLVETPHYEPLSRVPRSLGANVTFFERRRDDNYAVDIARVLSLATDRTRVVALSNLHNPTGLRVPDETIRALAQALATRTPSCTLLVDEAYAAFDSRCDEHGIFLHSARNLGDNIVTTSSLTKTFGYGPERIGWVLARPEISKAISLQLTTSLGVMPRSLAPLGAALFSRLAEVREELVPDLPKRRALCRAWVAAQPGLSWADPSEGLFGFVHVHNARNLRARIERGLDTEGVLVSPGEFFGDPGGFRLSWARPLHHVEEGLRRLERVLAE